MTHKIRIQIDAIGRGSVSIDGRPILCRGIRMESLPGHATRLWLDVDGHVEIDVETGLPAGLKECSMGLNAREIVPQPSPAAPQKKSWEFLGPPR
jgi:hypothetical protein